MKNIVNQFVLIVSFILAVGHYAYADCPAGWSYYPKQKACQYYSKNVLALNCNAVASQSYTASQTCGNNAGNCRALFISICEKMKTGCRQDVDKDCKNDKNCIKQFKCPGQFVVHGVVMTVKEEKVVETKKTDNVNGSGNTTSKSKNKNGSGNGVANGEGTGDSGGTGRFGGGLGTGEGY